MQKPIIIGTRGSELALWQAHTVKKQLEDLGQTVEIKIIKTRGDNIQHLSFDKIEGKGFFTKELEEELLNGSIDLAVHSHKDLETTYPEGLTIAAVSARENPADVLLIRKECVDHSAKFLLKKGAVVGTSSARRKSQLLEFRPDVEIRDIRGNVPTRIQKLRDGQYDAILLAKAGITRLALDVSDLEMMMMDIKEFIPAPAQGVLALQIRESDRDLNQVLQPLNVANVGKCIGVEREILRLFKGGCQLPLGAYCEKSGGGFKVWAAVAEAWDKLPARINLFAESEQNLAADVVSKLQEKKKSASS
ncbi:MAG: hydroxymethylbilane synthase [Bacteroidota bacterium]